MIPGSWKSRQNHDEYRKMQNEKCAIMAPKSRLVTQAYAEEITFSKSGKAYAHNRPIYLTPKA